MQWQQALQGSLSSRSALLHPALPCLAPGERGGRGEGMRRQHWGGGSMISQGARHTRVINRVYRAIYLFS